MVYAMTIKCDDDDDFGAKCLDTEWDGGGEESEASYEYGARVESGMEYFLGVCIHRPQAIVI